MVFRKSCASVILLSNFANFFYQSRYFSTPDGAFINKVLTAKNKIMKNKKTLLIGLLTSGLFLQLACQSINFAQGRSGEAANQANENKKTEIAFNEKPTSVNRKTAQPAPTPKPKAKPVEDNFVCVEPNLPCQHEQKQFDDWELSFRMPAKLIPNKVYKSAPFYAVILKKYDEGCEDADSNTAVEPERLEIQELFPSRKVFAEYSCPNMAAVNYDFAGRLDAAGEQILYMDYIAVYAGVTETEGHEIYNLVKKDYPQAELKRMTAEFSLPDQ